MMTTYNILIVEDDLVIQTLIKKLADKYECFEVEFADHAVAATNKISTETDIIFLDHNLKGHISGGSLLSVFADLGKMECEIVVISGQDDVKVFAEAIANGATHYYCKDDLFLEKIDRYLQSFIQARNHSMLDKLSAKFWPSKRKRSVVNHVVILDDDPLFSFAVQRKMDLLAISSSDTFTSPVKFLEFIENRAEKLPDLVFLDYSMPEMNGLEVLDRLESLDEKMKICVITSQQDVGVAAKLREMPQVVGYMVKDREFLARLDEIMLWL